MSYLVSGTTYPISLSTTLPGITAGGQDYVSAYNTVSGSTFPIATSRVWHDTTGPALYIIGAPETELQNPIVGTASSSTPSTFNIYDVTGNAATHNITVSGTAGAGILINGATTYVISSNYGSATFTNFTGNVWNAK